MKRTPTRRCTASLAIALVALTAGAGVASATLPTPASGSTWSDNQHVKYRWKGGDEPPGWMRAAVNAAAQDSNASRDSRAAVLEQSDAGASWIAYTGDMPTDWAIGYTTRNIPDSFTMRLRPQGYPLDWGTLRWCQAYASPPNGCYDAEMIALHEFGHAQTLGHADEGDVTAWTDTVMHAAPKTKAKAGWNAHEFGRCDVARLQIRYGPLKASTPYSTCLDLDTQLSLSASASSVGYNGSLTLTAKLKVDPNTPWSNIASEPLDGRKVTLQRRSPSASSWSNFGSMSAYSDGTGRYALSTTVTSTYDWRAVFSSPSGGGLEGSASPVVRVTVSYSCSSTTYLGLLEPTYQTC